MRKMLTGKKVKEFLDEVASDSPAPGGGSVAALCGAMGASLASMVSRLTIGKKGYEDVQELFEEHLQNFENLRKELTRQIDRDTEAFNTLVDAFRMPKKTEEQKRKRSKKIQEGYKNAARVPLETVRKARRLIDLLSKVGDKGNKNALSDIAVSAFCALTALKGAALNVRINLPAIKDDAFVASYQKELQKLLSGAEEEISKLVGHVREEIKK